MFTGPVVVISGYTCLLLTRIGLNRIRAEVRGDNQQLDAELLAMHLAGLAYAESSTSGTSPVPNAAPVGHLKQHHTVGTTTAATQLNMSSRGIRRAINDRRLRATLVDGRYRITNEDLAAYAGQRR